MATFKNIKLATDCTDFTEGKKEQTTTAKKLLLLFVCQSFFLFCGGVYAEKTVGALLDDATYQQETVGDVNAALSIYEQLMSEDDARRPDIAKATYQAGLCYLKNGDYEKAAKAFEAVLAKFYDQQALANKARAELDKLKEAEASGNGPAIHKGPKAISFYPAKGATNVPYGEVQIRIGFDQPMDSRIACLRFKKGEILADRHEFNYDASKNEFTFTFSLKPGTHYVINSYNDYKPFKGTDGRSSQNFEFNFTTAALAESSGTKPKIVAISPAPDTTWTRLTNMQITFDQPVKPQSGKFTFPADAYYDGAVPGIMTVEQPAKTITFPLVLSSSGHLRISDFVSETGAISDPCEIDFSLSSKSLSSETEAYLKTFESDKTLINLIEKIQKASQEMTSVSETVQASSIAGWGFSSECSVFRFQKPQQFYCDISQMMSGSIFKIGSDGQNCWFFYQASYRGQESPAKFYVAPNSEFNDVKLKFVRPFPIDQNCAKIIKSQKLAYIGKDIIKGTACEMVRSYQLDSRYPQIVTYWIDSQKFIPVRVVMASVGSRYQFDFTYDSLNTALAESLFKCENSDTVTPSEPEPLGEGYTNRFIIVHDGSDSRMSGGWGKKGPKGTSGSGSF